MAQLGHKDRPEVGDSVWDIGDDPDTPEEWSKIVEVIEQDHEIWMVVTDYPSTEWDERVLFVMWQGNNWGTA